MKHITGFVLVMLCINAAYACDVCGTSAGNQGLGLLPQMYKHFAGIQYQHRAFKSKHPALSDTQPDTYSEQSYRTAQVWGRFCPGKRWQIFGFIPYKYNSYMSDNTVTNSNGIGDVSILINYTIIQTPDSATIFLKHRLQAGGGIKAPTGSYSGITERELSGLPNIQPGSNSWDIPLNINYTLRYKKVGVNADVNYIFTTPNSDRYKYGNRLSTQLISFYWIQINDLSVLPLFRIRNEYALHDYDNYDKQWLNTQSGGNILSVGAGVQLYYKSLGIQLNYTIPALQYYGGGYVQYKHRLDTGIMFLF